MNKKFNLNFGTVCYAVAAVLAVIAIYMLYENVAYINEYLTAYGMTFADMKGDVIQTVLSAFTPYFAYAFVVFAAGKIYNAVAGPCVCDCGDECGCDEECACECVGVCECEGEGTCEEAVVCEEVEAVAVEEVAAEEVEETKEA
ncbi:MAG: hypothetical protein IKU44_04790 [Firmicutes bacterium]|nr:hypothetical protein [Bacillota bacterium]